MGVTDKPVTDKPVTPKPTSHCSTLEVLEHQLTELKSEIRKEVLEDLENWKKQALVDLKSDMLEMKRGINECHTNPCQHSGTCQDLTIGYLCHCPPGTTGKNCETDVNECLNNPCLNGVCEDRLNHYQCVCES